MGITRVKAIVTGGRRQRPPVAAPPAKAKAKAKVDPDAKAEPEKPKNRAEVRRRKVMKHTRTITLKGWQGSHLAHSTQTPWWIKKARSRRRSKMARASRRANR